MTTDIEPTAEDPADSHVEHSHSPLACANCGTSLSGPYCSMCGQWSEPLRKPIGRFLREAFIEFFGVDGRLWRSLNVLIFSPGRLTQAYLNGKRVRFVRPLRLYLLASVLFFFLLSIIDPVSQVNIGGDDSSSDTTLTVSDYRTTLRERIDESNRRVVTQETLVDSLERKVQRDSLQLGNTAESSDELEELIEDRDDEREDLEQLKSRMYRENRDRYWTLEQLEDADPDSMVRPSDFQRVTELLFDEAPSENVNINLPDWWPKSEAVEQMSKARTREELMSAFAGFFRDLLRRIPTVIFLLMPVFAMLLKVLYIRRDWYYSEHLVFALHIHAFTFVVFTTIVLISWTSGEAAWAGWASLLFAASIPIYYVNAHKHVYGQSWPKTLFKSLVLGWMYFFALLAGTIARANPGRLSLMP